MKTLLLIFALAIASCNTDKTNDPVPVQTSGNVTFYIYPQTGSDTWQLLLDGHLRGTLNESSGAPMCGSSNFLTIELLTGNHTVDAQNMNGHAWGHQQTITVSPGCESYEVALH